MTLPDRDEDAIQTPTGTHAGTGVETEAAPGNMLPTRQGRRSTVERGFVRLVATTGIIGIAVLLGAVLTSNKVQGWIIGLVVGLVSVVLAAVLWSSRQL